MSSHDKPFPTSWICDNCQGPIKSALDGKLEWEIDKQQNEFGFHIVHHFSASPKVDTHMPKEMQHGCTFYPEYKQDSRDMGLDGLVGPDGLLRLLSFLEPGLLPEEVEQGKKKLKQRGEIIEVIRRLHIPYYEEAREFMVIDEEWPDGLAGSAAISQEVLKEILRRKRRS